MVDFGGINVPELSQDNKDALLDPDELRPNPASASNPFATIAEASSYALNVIEQAIAASGAPAFLADAGGLDLVLVAQVSNPFKYVVHGQRKELTANVTLTVTDSAHNFIWIDIDGELGRSATPCTYSYSPPGGPVAGDHWFGLLQNQMFEYSGGTWVTVSRIFIGYVRADTGAINSAIVCEAVGLGPLERVLKFGDGSDGFLDVSAGTTTIDGQKSYTAVVVRGAGLIKHTAAVATQLDVSAQGIFACVGTGGVDLNGLGGIGSLNGADAGDGGLGGGGGGGGAPSDSVDGGKTFDMSTVPSAWIKDGALGSGVDEVSGDTGATSSIPDDGLREPTWLCLYGSGGGEGGSGGSGFGQGGAGGGGIQIRAASFAVGASAICRANGTNGAAGGAGGIGGGGGGGGGVLAIFSRHFLIAGTFTVTAGSGAAQGGGIASNGGNGGPGRAFQRRW